ncbi:DNA-binding transcriptional regulator, LysR family [Mameliella alba]|uniref:LysR family transcriptional regulator n=1 Tax=Mameliella alba TaxID=561184 RepID=UPI00089038B3|nr:LysR family transcriptional regulator [Mameliella alba]OWV46508.1 LysR family transcriptional regulator [Mameliella alba]PTR37322.1 DNA-binding transcriptional LysR family regulator [Mameliella alba]GGF73852.1 transcriptional regulator [Mameliella alba]SDD75649.1 DNA-binding transcriptional regulator, LysR family [Mameliella alba]
MPDIDLRLLRLFLAVYETGSTTRAAVRLGLSQPSVSIGLGQLRAHYGDPLFVQMPGGMTPTPLADHLAGPIRRALDDVGTLSAYRAGFDPSRSTRRFRIAMSDASHLTLLPHLFAAIRRAAPHSSLEASPIDAGLGERLSSGAADIAIGLIPGLEAGFYQRVLYYQGWVAIHRAGHPLGLLTRDSYAGADHVEVTNGTGQSLLHTALEAAGITRRIALSLPGFLGLPSVLTGSDLIATLPRHIGTALSRQAGLGISDCPIPIDSFQVKVHWHARVQADPTNAWLRETAFATLAHLV